jgi:hypothetical protein
MAYANYDALLSSIKNPGQRVETGFSNIAITAGRFTDNFVRAYPVTGVAPGSAAAPTNATAGALPFQNGNTGQLILNSLTLNSTVKQTLILGDRLSHQSGLSGNVTGEQTTSLPTAALTRYTGAVDVMAAVTIYNQIGATTTTCTIRYTNQAGTGSRVSKAITIGGTGFREPGRMLLIPLADGDTGVQSIQGFTLAATTGTLGSIGLTLFKPLFMCAVDTPTLSDDINFMGNNFIGGMPEILDNSCLFWMCISPSTSANVTGFANLSEV